jgi:hypothetical protein
VEKSGRKNYITERNGRSSWEWQEIFAFYTCQCNEWKKVYEKKVLIYKTNISTYQMHNNNFVYSSAFRPFVNHYLKLNKLQYSTIFMAWQSLVSQGFLTVEALRSHSDTLQEVGLLRTSDKPVAETLSNTRRSQETDILAAGGIRTRNPSKRAALDRDRQDRQHSSQFTWTCSVLCAVSTWWMYGPQVLCVRPSVHISL